MKSSYLYIGLAALMMTACNNEESVNEIQQSAAVQFNAGIQSRVKGTEWEKKDVISISMMKSGSFQDEDILRNNVAYESQNSGATYATFAAKEANTEIYYPETGKVDFYAYYPYSHSVDMSNPTSHVLALSVADQRNEEAIDLLYSNNAKELSTEQPTVNLEFKHRLSKVEFVFTSSDASVSEEQLRNIDLKLSGIATEYTFDYLANNLIELGNYDQEVTFANNCTDEVVNYSAVVLPNENASIGLTSISIPMENEEVKTSTIELKELINPGKDVQDTYLQSGKKYVIVLDLKLVEQGTKFSEYTIELNQENSVKIIDWEELVFDGELGFE